MATIKWRTARNMDNVKVVRAEIGMKWAMFSFAGELMAVGEGRCCEPAADELAQMVAESVAAIDALVAAEAPAKSTYRPATRRSFDNRYDMRRGANLSRAMDYEDSAL